MSSFDVAALAETMRLKAAATAAAGWQDIRETAEHEFRVLARRIDEIAGAVEQGQITKPETAIRLFAMAKNHLVATLALLNTLVLMTAQKIVDAAVAAIRETVNSKIGFALI
jgi:hypothetical protein